MCNGIAFLHVPFVAPMIPPLGIPVLMTFLNQNGIASSAYDLNVELYRKLLEDSLINQGIQRIKDSLSYDIESENEKNRIIRLLLSEEYIKDNILSAASKMSDGGIIKNHKELWTVANIVSKAVEISTYGLAGLNSTNPINLSFESDINKFDNLFKNKTWDAIMNWYMGRIDDICFENEYMCFSLCYDNQLFFFLKTAQYIREKYKNKTIIIGGPVVSSAIRGASFNITTDFFNQYSDYIDYIVVGDGEYPLLDLFNGKKNNNVLTYPFKLGTSCEKSIAPPLLVPSFSALPLKLYFSPQLVLPLITSRHCYWGKCKFCTHSVGYNGYKKYSFEDIKKCVQTLYEELGAKKFYFVDECMAMTTASDLARWISDDNLDILWMTDMRFEKQLIDADFVKRLANGGLRYIAFGMESANDRVLEKMNKGTTRDIIQKTIDNCHQNNISNTLMFFFGFPTETLIEAEDTIKFVIDNSDKISGIGMGCFTLVPGSYVYSNPNEFGITDIYADGYYMNNEGMDYTEIRNLFAIWNDFIKKNYYRGHPFYHRVFYLLELDKTYNNLYPLGLTSYRNIKTIDTTKVDENTPYELKKSVLCRLITVREGNMLKENIYLMDTEKIVEEIYCIDTDFFKRLKSQQLRADEIKALADIGVIDER